MYVQLHPNLSVWDQTSNLKPQTSYPKPQASNLKPQTSNLKPQTFWSKVWDVWAFLANFFRVFAIDFGWRVWGDWRLQTSIPYPLMEHVNGNCNVSSNAGMWETIWVVDPELFCTQSLLTVLDLSAPCHLSILVFKVPAKVDYPLISEKW